jgi:hypothetical protein
MGIVPLAPAEHVNEAEEQGHLQVVVHRHLHEHGLFEHHADRRSGTVDHGEGPVVTLSSVYNIPTSIVILGLPRTAGTVVETPAPRRLERTSSDPEILIHGPPRAPTGLRAPPFLPTT